VVQLLHTAINLRYLDASTAEAVLIAGCHSKAWLMEGS
jgi:hypothetical protein